MHDILRCVVRKRVHVWWGSSQCTAHELLIWRTRLLILVALLSLILIIVLVLIVIAVVLILTLAVILLVLVTLVLITITIIVIILAVVVSVSVSVTALVVSGHLHQHVLQKIHLCNHCREHGVSSSTFPGALSRRGRKGGVKLVLRGRPCRRGMYLARRADPRGKTRARRRGSSRAGKHTCRRRRNRVVVQLCVDAVKERGYRIHEATMRSG